MKDLSYASNGTMPPILHNVYDLMGKTSYLVSRREKLEGKTAVAIF